MRLASRDGVCLLGRHLENYTLESSLDGFKNPDPVFSGLHTHHWSLWMGVLASFFTTLWEHDYDFLHAPWFFEPFLHSGSRRNLKS